MRGNGLQKTGKRLMSAADEIRDWRPSRRAAWMVAAGAAAGTALGATAGLGLAYGGYRLLRSRMAADLGGQVVLITGSSRGLGLAMAREFAALGCKLALCARDADELQTAASELARSGVPVLAIPCDIGEREQVERMVAQATERYGRIDVLVNNAGIISVGPLESQTIEDFEKAMKVMFWGVVYPTLAVLPQMLERRSGRIANITSIGGKISVPHLVPYNCAKFAAVGFSEGLRAELGRHNIKVTTVVPGLMRTGSHVNAFFKGKNEAEYSWFALSATMPVVAMNAKRAARKVVRAVREGRSEIILTPQARLATAVHGLFPGITADVLGLVNRLLPNPNGDRQLHLGKESETAVSRSFLTAFGKRAARDLNQTPEQRTSLQSRGLEPAAG
jgi:short-subunit dehydrogenase